MTVKITDKAGLLRCLEILHDEIEAGHVSGVNLHYEANGVSRLSITWAHGIDDVPDLPGIPEADPDEETTKR